MRVIMLHNYSHQTLTRDEYAEIMRELNAKAMCDDITLGDQVLYRLLKDNESSYLGGQP